MASFRSDVEPILDEFCYDCHGLGTNEGGVTLDEFTAETIADTDLWLRVLRNTRSHIMPPREEALPSDEDRKNLRTWIKTGPFGIDPANPDPGQLTVQRLNRIEYQNTIYDLMGVNFDTRDAFPPDNTGEGFDNIGEILTLSPMLLEKYFDAAINIVGQAVPLEPWIMPERKLEGEKLAKLFSPAPNAADRSDEYLQLSFYDASTRFAQIGVDRPGKYQIGLKISPKSFVSFQGFDYSKCRLIFRIDNEVKIDQEFENTSSKIFEYTFDYDWVPGEHQFSFEVVPVSVDPEKIKRLKMRVDHLTIRGPFDRSHWVRPENYAQFFPGDVPQDPAARHAYTNQLLSKFAARAFRRPVDAITLKRLVNMAEEVAAQDGFNFESGMAQAMTAVLASPRFLFREEAIRSASTQDTRHPEIDDFSLASRLSYFLWSTMPDAELMELAENNQLRPNLEQQIARMMQDPRSDNFMKNFAGQWLHARDIESVNVSSLDIWLRDNPDPTLFIAQKEYSKLREIPENQRTAEQQADYDRTRAIVRAAYNIKRPQLKRQETTPMRQETEMFFEYVIRKDRPIAELIDSNYTFLNEHLANHYGIPDVKGRHMRRVELPAGSPRGGVLTQGTLLAYTSNPTRTSPVKRGVFILENILGTPPAAPPPNIPALEDITNPDDLAALSLRETLAMHREDPLCSSCHERMDPLGLALENFNAMGRWRESELNQPIDMAGQLVTGETFDSIQEFKHVLATERLSDFYYCFSEKLLTYALGRGLEYYDVETVDHLVETLKSSDGRPSALFRAIVSSAPFQQTRHPNLTNL
ncbi:MAG: DUF1592 domain-containing protein [Opitutaceae bacterium]|tara:strand:+ start:2568 stop:4994 length:2427 start_codon:yes stop_codon:yes gene_type:complete